MRVDDLLATTRGGLPQCPDIVIVGALSRAAAELFRQSQAWQGELDPLQTIAGLSVYDYGADNDVRVENVLWAKCGDRTLSKCAERDLPRISAAGSPIRIAPSLAEQTFTLWPAPDAEETVTLYTVLVPTGRGAELPDDLLTQYRDGISALAKAELMKSDPGQPYYDPAASAVHARIGAEWIVRAKRRQTSGAWAPMRVQPRPFV